MIKKVLLGAMILAVLGAGAIWIGESMLEPKCRKVTLEEVPASDQPPDVTFMAGAVMVPPVHTNPFLQIFSALENATNQLAMVPSSLTVLNDNDVIFVWRVFGRDSVWRLVRSTQTLTPLLIQPGGGPTHKCGRTFPSLAAIVRPYRNLEIRPAEKPGHIDIKIDKQWVEMELAPAHSALWPRRARPA